MLEFRTFYEKSFQTKRVHQKVQQLISCKQARNLWSHQSWDVKNVVNLNWKKYLIKNYLVYFKQNAIETFEFWSWRMFLTDSF